MYHPTEHIVHDNGITMQQGWLCG